MKPESLIKNYEELVKQHGDSGYAIYSKTTGEVADIPCGTSMIPPDNEYKTIYGKDHKCKFNEKELFVKVYKNPIEVLGKELSNRDFAWFMRLVPYISQSECILRDSEDRYINLKTLSEILDVDYSNLKAVYKSLEKLQLVGKVERQSQKDIYKTVKVIVVNPYIFCNGQNLIRDVYELFKDSRWAHLNDELKKIKK